MFPCTVKGINFKIFLKEGSGEKSSNYADTNKICPTISDLNGERVKEFYEEVLKDSSVSYKKRKFLSEPETKTKPRVQLLAKPIQSKTFRNTDLLWMAQNNDIMNLNLYFSQSKNHDINIVDDFGWTPLMCASCSGADKAVLILLENGADPDKCGKLGETALGLARRKNQKKIVQILENFKYRSKVEDDQNVTEKYDDTFFCSTCNDNFGTDKKSHETSTVHLFNCPLRTSTFYGIPESNRGFQLLLREGWDKEKGLGRDGKENSTRLGMENPTRSLKYLEEMEKLGEEILTDRQEIIALDKRRNETREGLRELRNLKDEKTWFAFGPLLVKYPTKKIQKILEKDQVQVDAEINKLRSNLKIKINDLRDMEHKPPVPGLMLKAMTPEEMKAVSQILGRHAY